MKLFKIEETFDYVNKKIKEERKSIPLTDSELITALKILETKSSYCLEGFDKDIVSNVKSKILSNIYDVDIDMLVDFLKKSLMLECLASGMENDAKYVFQDVYQGEADVCDYALNVDTYIVRDYLEDEDELVVTLINADLDFFGLEKVENYRELFPWLEDAVRAAKGGSVI